MSAVVELLLYAVVTIAWMCVAYAAGYRNGRLSKEKS